MVRFADDGDDDQQRLSVKVREALQLVRDILYRLLTVSDSGMHLGDRQCCVE
jgi:hypothetical protein